MAYEYIDDFESGTGSWWEPNSVSIQQDSNSTEGNYSGYVSGTTSTEFKEVKYNLSTENPDTIRFEYYETWDNKGLHLSCYNSNGNNEIAAGSDNDSFSTVNDNSGRTKYSTGGYDTWVQCTLDFNWSSNEVTVSWNSDNGNSSSPTVSLNDGKDVSAIWLGYRQSGKAQDWYIDSLEWSGSFVTSKPSTPQNLTVS